jgi:DNA-binding CsgD family transcriptional regulator/tetratricopeptide (TPR) repeat protein
MVGRSEELRMLRAALGLARGHVPTAVLIEGEAGIGKSRLVQEAIAAATTSDDLVVTGHGVAMSGGELPFGMAADALRDLIRQVGPDGLRGVAASAVETLVPLVPEMSTGERTPLERSSFFDAFALLVDSLARDRLVWLVLEDLHWSDTSTRDLLAFLLRVAGPVRLLVTATLRDRERKADRDLGRFVVELARDPRVRRMELGPLSRGDVAEQVASLLRKPADPALLDRVVQLAQGVPFLTEELVRGGLEAGGPLPESATSLMLDRLTELSTSASTVVKAGSVATGQLWHGRLARVCGFEEREMAEASAEAVAEQVLEVDRTGMGYRFRHALLREAVLGSLLPAERLHWHRRWAGELESDLSSPDRAFASIAASHHWEETGEAERAFDATMHAVATARSLGAPRELSASLRRLLRLWDQVGGEARHPAEERDLIIDETIDALIQADDWLTGLAVIDEELARPFSEADHVRRTALRVRRRWFLQQLGMADVADPEALAIFGETLRNAPPGPLLVEALIRLGFDLVASDPEAALQVHLRAVEVATALRRPRKEFWARAALSMHLFLVGRAEEAVRSSAQMLPLARVRFPAEASHLEADYAWWLCCLGRYPEAEEVAQRALSTLGRAEQARRSWAVATAHLCACWVAIGRWDEAAARLAQTRDLGFTGTRGAVLHVLAGILAGYRGETKQAEEAAVAAQSLLPSEEATAWPAIRAWVTWLRMEVAAARDDAEALRALLAPLCQMPGLETASDVAWRPLLLAARVEADLACRHLGRHGGARSRSGDPDGETYPARLEEAAARLHRYGPVGAAWAAQFDAECARFRGSVDPEGWLDISRQWERLGHLPDQAWALFRAGEGYVVSGDKRSAVDVLRRAGDTADRLGASSLLAGVTDLVRESRLDLGGGAHSGPRPRALALTDREIEVLTLLASGRSNEEIARELFISPKTASVHVSRILAKLDARTRTEAAVTAHRLRLV